MFTFDVSIIDIVLVVAIIVLLFLYSSNKKMQPHTTERSHTTVVERQYIPVTEKPLAPIVEEYHIEERKPIQEEQKVVSKTFESQDYAPKSPETPPNCVHNFGYLESRPNNTPIPDECLGCSKVMQCLFQKENPKIT